MAYTLLEFRGKQGNSLGEAPPGEKRQLAAFRPKSNFVGQVNGQQRKPCVALMSSGIYVPQVSRAPRGSESFLRDGVFEGAWPPLPEQAALHGHTQGPLKQS